MTPIPSNRAAFTIAELLSLTGGSLVAGATVEGASEGVCGVSTDSRAPGEQALFVALQGVRFDGHDFLAAAHAAGAAAALVEKDTPAPVGMVVVRVASTLEALGRLAAHHRRRWGGRVVAVAGSAGKTTTCSAVGQVLTALLPGAVHKTPGNLNNRIGVPMVLLGLEPRHRVLVVELGTNQPGEVAALTRMAQPDIGVLTLIELEHTEGLGDIDGVEREERALYFASDCLAIGNADDERVARALAELSGVGRPTLSYGFAAESVYHIRSLHLTSNGQGEIELAGPRGGISLRTPYVGRPGALATVAAYAVLDQFRDDDGGPGHPALSALSAPQDAMRLTVRQIGRLTVVDDCYNANPASVRAALETAAEIAASGRRRLVLVLGEMRELGTCAEGEHLRIRQALETCPHAALFAAAGDARHFGALPGRFAEDAAELIDAIAAECRPGDVVLVKGSRGVGLERVVRALAQQPQRYS